MHGGDCGSSICRSGGGPTQCLTSVSGGSIVGTGDGVRVGGGGVGWPPLPPTPEPDPLAPLDDPPDPGGAFLMTCCPLGENSAAAGGAVAAACSSSGSRMTSTPTKMTRVIAPEARPGRRKPAVRLTNAPWATPAPSCCAAT